MIIDTGLLVTKVKTGENWRVVRPDGDKKAVLIKIGGTEEISVAISSLKDKRQWIEASTEAVELSEAETEYVKNDVETTMEVLSATGKIKRVKVKRESKPVIGVGKDIRDYIVEKAGSMEGVVLADSGRFTSLKIGNKMFAAIFSYSKKSLTLGVRSAAVGNLGYEPTSKANHMMDYRFKMTTLDGSDKKIIDELLDASAKYQTNKNNKFKEVH